MRIHLIAIGGSAMHNMAIALHKKGYHVTGSDDEIFEPSKSRLDKYGLLPESIGWDENRITEDIDEVILGMHAREDNPELLKAKELGLPIYSYPEYLYEQSKDKTRLVVGGSHGKTTVTSMILHVLNKCNKEFDYMVGAQLEGFEVMVKLSDAPIIVMEGDEYLSSPIDRRPKFHLYKPHHAIITGIAWDHINVFPTFENYVDQFSQFVDLIEEDGTLIYYSGDENLVNLANQSSKQISKLPYQAPKYKVVNERVFIQRENKEVPIKVFGKHNLENMEAARLLLNQVDISDDEFYNAIQDFEGASKRLEKIAENNDVVIYKDFAHSPSKLKATINAVKEQYAERRVIALVELHTFSSLNKKFLSEYEGAMDKADLAYVYYNPKTIEHKRLENISPQDIKDNFKTQGLEVTTNSNSLFKKLEEMEKGKDVFLLMSSGNFDNIDIEDFAFKITNS